MENLEKGRPNEVAGVVDVSREGITWDDGILLEFGHRLVPSLYRVFQRVGIVGRISARQTEVCPVVLDRMRCARARAHELLVIACSPWCGKVP